MVQKYAMKIDRKFIDSLKNPLLIHKECLDELDKMDMNLFDCCITDPPYGINFMNKDWDNDLAFKSETWEHVYRVLKPGAYLLSFAGTRTCHRIATAIENAGFDIKDQLIWLYGQGFAKTRSISNSIDKLYGARGKVVKKRKGFTKTFNVGATEVIKPRNPITAPESHSAKHWEGWGTSLAPAYEPIIMAQKPLSEKNYAENVLKWGVGGLNVDACKIVNANEEDRHPKNAILSPEAAELLDLQTGFKASRFFYCPKVSKKERNAGCEALPEKIQNSDGKGRTFNDRCKNCKKKFVGSEKTRCQCPIGKKVTDKTRYTNRNHHPTVKPVKLLQYLCRLVTPINGVILDHFMGSGSTGVAAVLAEHYRFVGIEMNKEYFEIAKARITNAVKERRVA